MKRLLPLFAGLTLVSCDSGTKHAEGTTSETQTSLQALATRLEGAGIESPDAPLLAARAAPAAMDSERLEGLSYLTLDVSYGKVFDAGRWFGRTVWTGRPTPAGTLLQSYKNNRSNRQMRTLYESWQEIRGCPDSNGVQRPVYTFPSCAVVEPGTRQTRWFRHEFRNGMILTPVDSGHGQSPENFVVDGRWVLQDGLRGPSDTTKVWAIHEQGRRIGTSRMAKSSWTSEWDWDEYLADLTSMVVFDLAGNIVPPDRTLPQERNVFPEDSLGLWIDSLVRTPDGSAFRMGISWRFLPGPELLLDTLIPLRLVWYSEYCPTFDGSCSFEHLAWIRLGAVQGRASLEVPVEAFPAQGVDVFRATMEMRVESTTGVLPVVSRHFSASIEARCSKDGTIPRL